MNEASNLASLIEKQKEMFTKYAAAYGEDGSAGQSVPPPSPELLRRPSGPLKRLSKGVRRRSMSAKQAYNSLKKHGGRVKGGEYEIEKEREYSEGEARFFQFKKDLAYLVETLDKYPASIDMLFGSFMEVALASVILANDCLTKDLVGGDDDFER